MTVAGLGLALLSILMTSEAHAGRVRTLYVGDKAMETVSLSLGRSTILRFDEKPRNAVVGNQNYFSLEFIGNDITVQPQGTTTTNLFVYTDSQTYGLILRTGKGEGYDDLVNVRYRPGFVRSVGKKKLFAQVSLQERVELKDTLRVQFVNAIGSLAQGVTILEFDVENLSQDRIPTNAVVILLTQKDGSTPIQKVALLAESIPSKGKTQGRLVIKSDQIGNSKVSVSYQGRSAQVLLSKKASRQ